MIDFKALLALLVVGQLGLSTAGRRHRPHHDGITVKSDNMVGNAGDVEAKIRELLTYTKVEENVQQFKNHLISLRDAPILLGQKPITNRKSHEVGQYLLIVRNTVAVLINDLHYPKLINPVAALKYTFDESMRHYTDDYRDKFQPTINNVTHYQKVLQPVFELVTDLSKETDPSQQLTIYLKYEFDNKPNGNTLINLLVKVLLFLEAVNEGPASKENVLVEQGAGRFVMLNWEDAADIAQSAWNVKEADPTKPTPPPHDKTLD